MTKLICAQCGDPIKTIEGGWVEWLRTDKPVEGSLRIVHHVTEKKGCQYKKHQLASDQRLYDLPLDWFKGVGGYDNVLEIIEGNSVTQKDGFALLRQLWEANL